MATFITAEDGNKRDFHLQKRLCRLFFGAVIDGTARHVWQYCILVIIFPLFLVYICLSQEILPK